MQEQKSSIRKALAALRPASSPGREAIGSMVKFIRFTKSITAPGVSPYPFSEKYAPAMNTPSWANMAVIAPIMPTIVTT